MLDLNKYLVIGENVVYKCTIKTTIKASKNEAEEDGDDEYETEDDDDEVETEYVEGEVEIYITNYRLIQLREYNYMYSVKLSSIESVSVYEGRKRFTDWNGNVDGTGNGEYAVRLGGINTYWFQSLKDRDEFYEEIMRAVYDDVL